MVQLPMCLLLLRANYYSFIPWIPMYITVSLGDECREGEEVVDDIPSQ